MLLQSFHRESGSIPELEENTSVKKQKRKTEVYFGPHVGVHLLNISTRDPRNDSTY